MESITPPHQGQFKVLVNHSFLKLFQQKLDLKYPGLRYTINDVNCQQADVKTSCRIFSILNKLINNLENIDENSLGKDTGEPQKSLALLSEFGCLKLKISLYYYIVSTFSSTHMKWVSRIISFNKKIKI